jgi:hypothetical protein
MGYLSDFGPNVEPSPEEVRAWEELAAMHDVPRIDFTVPARLLRFPPDDRL